MDHSQLPKKANKCSVGAVVSFSYVWRHSVSVSSLHRESTDSLIYMYIMYSICIHMKDQYICHNLKGLLTKGLAIGLINNTSVKIIKNEVGCRDDTVPKTVDTRRHCEEE